MQVDPAALAAGAAALDDWLDLAAKHLRTAAVMIANLLDPEAIVIGGIIPGRAAGAPRSRGWAGWKIPPPCCRAPCPSFQAEIDLASPALGGAALPLFDGLAPALSLLSKSV